ncbi:sulfatase-like hydrolase/transferase [Paenibacillus sp. 1P07SE]|uniref:sulfatase-like hydrolase/transferase n=1 Tax=Paenibacillus sp. 1P07SE TaxID=3132209 RepID=UPI0039A605E1
MKKPHLIIFNPDQWRGDVLGHMGNRAAVTPHLDRIVQTDAVSFRNAFCQNPVCTPSRCSFMSGWYPHVRGHRTMHHMMRPDEPVLLKRLKQEGYFVWWGGKNDLVPPSGGFDDYCDVKYKPPKPPVKADLHADTSWRGEPGGDQYYSFLAGKLEKDADAPYYEDGDWATVMGAIEQLRDAPADQPLCLYLALGYPHPPYGVESPFYELVDRQAVPARAGTPDWTAKPSLLKGLSDRQGLQGWTEAQWNELRAVYYGMCSRVDHQFGLLMKALKEQGLYEDTAVFVFSDHGDFTGDYGLVEKTQNTFEDCLTRVPFIVKPPRDVPVKAGVSDALVELIDFPATVEALLGIVPEHTHYGRSLLPVIAGETAEHRDAVFCEGGRLREEAHCKESQSLETTDSLYWPRLSLQQLDSAEHGKAVMCRSKRYKYIRRLYETDELYDLESDPQELRNRIDDPALAEVALAMKERLLTFYLETADAVPFQEDRRF